MSRLLPTLICLIVIFIAFALIRRGWASRKKRQENFGALTEVPARFDQEAPVKVINGTYVNTTESSDWLNRISTDTLGHKASARLLIYPDALIIERTGEKDIFLTAAEILAVKTANGVAGKFVEKDGLLQISWVLGEMAVDTSFRTQHAQEKDEAIALLQELSTRSS